MLLALFLTACNRGTQSTEAVRQGVIDHLAKSGFNMKAMEVTLVSADVKGNQADTNVSIGLKGGSPAQGMSRRYHLELQGTQWAVTSSQDAAGSPHGSAAAGANPHGGGAAPAAGNPAPAGAMPSAGGGRMPSPEDLPPSGKKK